MFALGTFIPYLKMVSNSPHHKYRYLLRKFWEMETMGWKKINVSHYLLEDITRFDIKIIAFEKEY